MITRSIIPKLSLGLYHFRFEFQFKYDLSIVRGSLNVTPDDLFLRDYILSIGCLLSVQRVMKGKLYKVAGVTLLSMLMTIVLLFLFE